MLTLQIAMAFDFSGKKILITGCGRGIGRALALAIAETGGEVYALSRTKETLDSLAKASERIHPIVADLRDWDQTKDVLEKLEAMDGVVNNAALLMTGIVDALECPKELLDSYLSTNLIGAINVIQSAGKKMVAAGKGGSIVNMSSILGVNPIKGGLYYDITKAALDMVTKQFALELGPHQIRVNSANPNLVLTETMQKYMMEAEFVEEKTKALTPLGRLCTVKEVVEPVMYLLSDHSTMVNGTIHVIDGGLLSNIPV